MHPVYSIIASIIARFSRTRKGKGLRLIETRREGSRQPLRDCEPYKRCISKQIFYQRLLFIWSTYFFYDCIFLSVGFFSFLYCREKKEVGENVARPPWRARVRERSRKGRRGFFRRYTASRWKFTIMTTIMRGEVKFTVPITAATHSLYILSYKKKVLSLCRYHGWKRANYSKLCGRINYSVIS